MQTSIRKNDQVIVHAGKDRGKKGRVLRSCRRRTALIVEGVNLIKRHTRPNPQKNIKGGIVEREAAIHARTCSWWARSAASQTRVGHKMLDDGRKVRICRKCEGVVDK